MKRNKLTKLVCTISDRKCDVDFIEKLYLEGMDVVRLNTAHQSEDDTLKVIENVRKVSNKIAILLDTKGPEIRTAEIEEDIELQAGETVYVVESGESKNSSDKAFSVNYVNFIKELDKDATILINDGEMEIKIVAKEGNKLKCEAANDGFIKNKKTVNVPDVHLELPAVTDKDASYIQFAIKHDIDFIAHSFVRSKEDVLAIQKILDEAKSEIKIISKIENREGVNNIDEIIQHSYGIMVARGDLGIELPAEEVPIVQKDIIRRCREWCRPVITATHMLETMIDKPRATRAEISDVANAILDGTDAVMLSGETAYGKYPIESVKTVTRIANNIDNKEKTLSEPKIKKIKSDIHNFLAKQVVQASRELPVKAAVDATVSGLSVRMISSYRAHIHIFAKCYSEKIMRELALSYGVFGSLIEPSESTDELIESSLKSLVEKKYIANEDLIVLLAARPGKSEGANFMKINTVEHCTSVFEKK